MHIVKVELLWSRHCKYDCSGCGMKKDVTYSYDGRLWEKAFKTLKKLGNEFVAIYGAEPLERFEHLADIIRMIKWNGMECTVITAYNDLDHMNELIDAGLNSVTVSYDENAVDSYRNIKNINAFSLLEKLNISDKACVLTACRLNQNSLIQAAEQVLSRGYWFLFDLMHPEQEFGKCRNALPPPSAESMHGFLDYLIKRKKQGEKIHPSLRYLEYLKANYSENVRSIWHCKKKNAGWLTVDHDGTIYPCDDYQVDLGYKIWEIGDNWDKVARSKQLAVVGCRGCAWNTHYDAVDIVDTNSLGSYVHSKVEGKGK